MTNHEYGRREVPLIPGEMYGMRAFRVRDDGTLGPLHRNKNFVYSEGINVAKCDDEPINWQITFTSGLTYTMAAPTQEVVHPDEPTPHIDCSCGFYAYFEDAPETSFMAHVADDRVNAIVRATGRCIVGDLGFKAEKMEVVGLVADAPDSIESKKAKFDRFMLDTSKRIDFAWWKKYMLFLIVHWTITILHGIYEKNAALTFAYHCTTLILWSVCIVAVVTGIYAGVRYRKMIKDIATMFDRPSPELTAQLVKAYPNIPLFSSLPEAKEYFPITKASDLPQ